jgi:hypothetical protein
MMAYYLGGENRRDEVCAVRLVASVLEGSWQTYTYMYKDDVHMGFVGWQVYM